MIVGIPKTSFLKVVEKSFSRLSISVVKSSELCSVTISFKVASSSNITGSTTSTGCTTSIELKKGSGRFAY